MGENQLPSEGTISANTKGAGIELIQSDRSMKIITVNSSELDTLSSLSWHTSFYMSIASGLGVLALDKLCTQLDAHTMTFSSSPTFLFIGCFAFAIMAFIDNRTKGAMIDRITNESKQNEPQKSNPEEKA